MNSEPMYIKTAGATSNASSFYAMNTAFSLATGIRHGDAARPNEGGADIRQ